jgi:predicted esterase
MPVLVLPGMRDTTVPVGRANEIPDLFRLAEADVQVEWVDAAHDFCAEDAQKSAAWLARFDHRPVARKF